MARYKYEAKSADGSVKKGVLEAENDVALYSALREEGLYPLSYARKRGLGAVTEKQPKRISTRDLALFCRQFASMLTAGVTAVRALDILYQQTEKAYLKESIRRIYEDVQRGDMLSEAFARRRAQFPDILINMVESGEASGTLDGSMSRLANQFEKDLKLKNKITSAMTYPIVLVFLSIAIIIALVTFVLPSFADLFSKLGAELPVTTRILMGFSNLLTGYWYILLLFAAFAVLGARSYLSTDNGRLSWDRLKLVLPIIKGPIVKIVSSRFCRTLSTLLASGIPLLNALEITARIVGNRVYQDGLNAAREDIRKGMSLTQALRKFGLFPPVVASMVSIGEESGSLDGVMAKLADFYEDEVETVVSSLVAFIEPAMIITLAFIVGLIIISVITPIFTIYGAMG